MFTHRTTTSSWIRSWVAGMWHVLLNYNRTSSAVWPSNHYHAVRVSTFHHLMYLYTLYLHNAFKYITIKVYMETLINTQQYLNTYLNTAQLWKYVRFSSGSISDFSCVIIVVHNSSSLCSRSSPSINCYLPLSIAISFQIHGKQNTHALETMLYYCNISYLPLY